MESIISEQAKAYASEKYREAMDLLKGKGSRIEAYVEGLFGEERVLMEFLYGTMPFCDVGDYEPALMHRYVKHGIFLRREQAWTKSLPEDIFLNYVLYHRVNNEDITDCRQWFYQKLWPFVEGKGQEEAVKEVNYWCKREVTYASSDERTLGPVGVYNSGSGRCGEESTFLVTALRSIGIGARQVYTPRWAHCDDNHAWVEAWVDGRWRFLGACEPEEILDRGWFTNASSRAMMIHTRVFSDYQSRERGHTEQITEGGGAALYYNDTDTYGKTAELTLRVQDEAGHPLSGARVDFEILNMAEFYPISTLYTDEEGRVRLRMGLGTVHIHVSRGTCCCECTLHNEADSEEVLVLGEELWKSALKQAEKAWQLTDYVAPRDYPMHSVRPTKEQKELGRARKREADAFRQAKLSSFRQNEGFGRSPRLEEALLLAYGNADQLLSFAEAFGEEEALPLLGVLAKKDYRDITAEVLTDHAAYAAEVKDFCCDTYLKGDENRQELFEKHVLNPRIRYEAITPYRSFLTNQLTEAEKEAFREAPEGIWSWVEEVTACEESKNYEPVVASPIGMVLSGQASRTAQKTLFVAICRTLGIPARINRINGAAEFYRNGSFREPTWKTPETEAGRRGQVRLTLTSQETPVYYSSWTIGRLTTEETPGETGRSYTSIKTLDLCGQEFENGTMCLNLEEGIYRVLTTVRLPNGNQLAASRFVDTKDFRPGEDGVGERVLPLLVRKPKMADMLVDLKLEEFALQDQENHRHSFETLSHNRNVMLAFLEEGMEPTEHLLLELLEQEKEITNSGLLLLLVVKNQEALSNATLRKVISRLRVSVCYDDFTELPEQLARRMYTDSEKLPLVILVSPGMRGRYACSGYNVGSVGLMLRIAEMLK